MGQNLFYLNKARSSLSVKNLEQPELFRELFPYKNVSRIGFDNTLVMHRPADPMFITDTTFRDGQQARPPYSVEQISHIFDLMHKLGGLSGLIRQCEFFLYSDKDRRAVEKCLAKGYRFPEVTGWIRANKDDLKLVKSMGLKETGMLTSVSDYHIYMKLGKDRQTCLRSYLSIVEKSLEYGIVPRCHCEDITRADIYGFCLPFAQKLMELSNESGLPVKIRLCDTMGYGVPYPGSSLPRSIARIVRAFTDEAGVPGEWLEWHGHNDFHKAMVNAVTAWMYGCSGANGTLLGFGERTGNAPVEGLVIEYISLTGDDDAAVTTTISEIAEYFERELGYVVPHNYPFVGRDFNSTSAGIHVDGLLKNEEIYNIFDTRHILGRSVPITITDKSGKAGVAYWINQHLNLSEKEKVSKRHPAVGKIYNRIVEAYEGGRNTSFSHAEMLTLAKRYLPELFPSEFEHLKKLAHSIAARIILKLTESDGFRTMDKDVVDAKMQKFLEKYPFTQFIYLTDTMARNITWQVSHPEDAPKYDKHYPDTNFADRDWFQIPMQTGKLHITDFYRSIYTGKLCLTVSAPLFDDNDEIMAILGGDIRFEELLKIQSSVEEQVKEDEDL
ncbi:MAG: histone-lysine N-methyltransferase [Desulfovibrionales bacterium]